MTEREDAPGHRVIAEEFVRALGFHDEHGGVLPGAYDEVAMLLRHFVTESGKLPQEVRGTLGASGYGRKSLLRLILRAFVGPEPNIDAWRSALAAGGFKLIGAPAAKPEERRSGTPGTYLPRALQRIHSRAPRPCLTSDRGRVQSDTAVQAAIALGLILQRACSAGAAMGPALVLLQATDRLTPAQWRHLDAHLFDETVLGDLAEAIAKVLQRHPLRAERERTNAQVMRSVRDGPISVERYFEERESQLAAVAALRIQEALRQGISSASDDTGGTIYDQVANELRAFASAELAKSDDLQHADEAIAYLNRGQDDNADLVAQHMAYLQRTMRDLVRPRDRDELQLIYRTALDEQEGLGPTGEPLGRMGEYFVYRIRRYAATIGPPPVGTPAAHIAIFERQAIALAMTEKQRWQAGERWLKAGLLGPHLHWIFQ